MICIYIDESGSWGFNKKSTKNMALALLTIRNPDSLGKKLRRYRKKKKIHGELHFNEASPITRKEVLEIIAKNEDLKLAGLVVEKIRINPELRKVPTKFYNYITGILLQNLVMLSNFNEKLKIVVDKRFNKACREEFNKYIAGYRVRELEVDIEHKESYSAYCLQAVDFVAGALFQKYERDDSQYYDIIKDKFITPEIFLWDKE